MRNRDLNAPAFWVASPSAAGRHYCLEEESAEGRNFSTEMPKQLYLGQHLLKHLSICLGEIPEDPFIIQRKHVRTLHSHTSTPSQLMGFCSISSGRQKRGDGGDCGGRPNNCRVPLQARRKKDLRHLGNGRTSEQERGSDFQALSRSPQNWGKRVPIRSLVLQLHVTTVQL